MKKIDDYILLQKEEIRQLLEEIRKEILKSAPEAVELISYGMPAFKIYGKMLAYFAAHTHHIGFYATPSANVAFAKELKEYKTTKGTVQLPYNKPIPYDLVGKMIQYKANELAVNQKKKK